MFLVKKPIVRKVSFYIVVALGMFIAYIDVQIGLSLINMQSAIGVCVGITAITALIIALTSKDDEKKFLIAQIVSAIALIVGMFNAFI